MKAFFTALLIITPLNIYATDKKWNKNIVPGSIIQMTSIRPDRLPNVPGDFRFRAYVWAPYEQGYYLGIDKVSAEDNFFDKSQWHREVRLSDSKELKPIIEKLSFGRKLGCCRISNLRWKKEDLFFETTVGKSKYKCSIPKATVPKSILTCKK